MNNLCCLWFLSVFPEVAVPSIKRVVSCHNSVYSRIVSLQRWGSYWLPVFSSLSTMAAVQRMLKLEASSQSLSGCWSMFHSDTPSCPLESLLVSGRQSCFQPLQLKCRFCLLICYPVTLHVLDENGPPCRVSWLFKKRNCCQKDWTSWLKGTKASSRKIIKICSGLTPHRADSRAGMRHTWAPRWV